VGPDAEPGHAHQDSQDQPPADGNRRKLKRGDQSPHEKGEIVDDDSEVKGTHIPFA
jgi:hypothetical protein